jgi:2,5-furandicarboxylate decarboxylase 1
MARDFREFIRELELEQELIRVKDELSSRFEVSAAVNILSRKHNKAVLFERIHGYSSPVAINLLGSKKRLAMALGVKEDKFNSTYLKRKGASVKPKLVENNLPDEVFIKKDVDILKTIPALTHNAKDAGPYFTASITVARDPETGMLGMGLHRIQVKGKNEVGICLMTPPLSDFLKKAENMNQPLEIAIVNGVHPAILMASVMEAPVGVNKFEIAGGLLQKSVNMVKCKTVNLEVPAEAEFVLEGEIFNHKKEKDGPFGESSGFYWTTDSPVAKIRSISHQISPIYQALLPFGGEDFALFNFMWGLELMQDAKKKFPFIKDMIFKGMNYMAVVQIDKTSDDQATHISDYLLRSPFIKIVVVVDSDIDLCSSQEVLWAICTRMHAATGIHINNDLPGHPILDPSLVGKEEAEMLTSKLLIDATMPLENKSFYEKIEVPESVRTKIESVMAKYLNM